MSIKSLFGKVAKLKNKMFMARDVRQKQETPKQELSLRGKQVPKDIDYRRRNHEVDKNWHMDMELYERLFGGCKGQNLYRNGELKKNEFYLICAVRNEAYLEKFVLGIGEYRLPYDSTVSQEFYFTNIPLMLRAFYDLNEKYPEFGFDKLLENTLLKLSDDKYSLFELLNVLYVQVENEKQGISPFIAVTVEMLMNCRKHLKKVKDNYRNIKRYQAVNKENGYLDVIAEFNELFKEEFEFDIFDESDSEI